MLAAVADVAQSLLEKLQYPPSAGTRKRIKEKFPPKTHVLFVFVENIERTPVGSPHNHCKAHKMRWIVAGRYLLPSFFPSSIVNKYSHFTRLSASSVCKMSIGHLSLQRLLHSVIHSVRARRAYWSFFCVFLGTTPFNVSSRASEMVGSANRLGIDNVYGRPYTLSMA